MEAVRTFSTSLSPRPAGAGAGLRPDGKRPRRTARGPLAGAYLWAAGYAPARKRDRDAVRSSPLATIVLTGPNGVNPAARPIPPVVMLTRLSAGEQLAP